MDSTTDTSFAGLKTVLETNNVTAATSAAALGILFHVTVVRYLDVDNFMYTFLALLWAASALVTSAHLLIGFSFISACARVLLLAISFDAGLFLSMAVYRVFFHRLRKFPGPFGAKVSRFYSAYLVGKDVKYYKEVEKMHQKYGDFIRTGKTHPHFSSRNSISFRSLSGPREVAIVRKSAVPLILGPTPQCRKSTWYMQVDSDSTKCSIHMSRDYYDHKRRRRAWDRGFAIKGMGELILRMGNHQHAYMESSSEHLRTPYQAKS